MSLILEALRKSEAQRRLSQVPDLMSPMPGSGGQARRWTRTAAYGAALVVVAGAAWWLGQRNSAAPIAPGRETPTLEQPVSLAPTRTSAVAEPPVVAPRPQPAAPNANSSQANMTVRIAAPKPTPSPERDATRNAPMPAASVAPKKSALPSRAAPIPAPPQQAVDVAATVTAEPPLPLLADLSSAERQSLPPLRITMHVFAERAAQRFAIIDGHRVGEGALLADGVTVGEITRDAVILDLRGRHIRLPRP